MAYQYPLNGGRINASIGGNSTSAGAGYSLISTGNMILAGGNNITLSQNGQSISIAGNGAGAGLSAGTQSVSTGTVNFANSNGVTFGMSGSSQVTASHNGLTSQSNQALSASNGSFAFQTAGFSNANGVTFGTSAGSIMTASVNTSYAASNHSHGNPTLNLTNISGTTASASNGLTLSLSAAAQTVQTQNMVSVLGSTGNVSFANSNGITFGGNASTITASHNGITSQTNQTIGGYALGNTTGQSSSSTIDARSLRFNGAGNISVGYSAGSVMISGTGDGGIALANSQTTYTSGTVSLVGAGGITVGSTTGQGFNISGPSVSSLSATGAVSIFNNAGTISIGAPAFSAGMTNIGNTSGTQATASNQLIFAGGNNITLSQATGAGGNTLSISAANQTNQNLSLYALGNTTQNSSTLLNASNLSFNGLGGVSVGYSNGSIQISGGAGGGGGVALYDGANSISSGTARISAGGALTASINGQTLSLSAPAQSSISGTGIISISRNGATISIGAPAFSAGMSTGGNTSGTTGTVSNQLVFAGGNNITLSQATGAGGNTLSIIGGAGGGGGLALANSQTTYTSGTANLNVAGGAMTIASTTGQSYNFSVPGTSSLSATGAVSISTNGGTISIGAPAVPTLSRWESPEGIFTSLGLNGNGSLSINHVYMPFNVTGSAMKIGGSLNASTNTSATTASVNITLWMGIYTLNGSTLSLASSGSALQGFQWSQSASTSANTSVQSMRQMTVPMNINMTPGQYWAAAVISSQTTYTGVAYSIFGNNLINNAASGAVLSPIGVNTSANRDAMLFQGIYTSAVSSGPASMVGTDINNTSASNVMRANFYHAIYNATY